MNEGWICPRCDKVNAPDVKACDCKFEKSIIDELKKLEPIPKQPEPIEPYYPPYCPPYRPVPTPVALWRPNWWNWYTVY